MNHFLEGVKDIFGQVSRSDTVKTTGASVKQTATRVGNSAQKMAKQAAGKAQATAAGLGSRGTEATPDVSANGNHAEYGAAEIGVSPVAGTVPISTPGASGLPESAQAIIDQSRQQATAFIRDTSVELETAPDITPPDTVDAFSDVDPGIETEDVEDAARGATSETYQE